MAFKIKKSLTPPLFKLATGVPRYFKVLDKMFVGKEMVNPDPSKKKMEPATLLNVLELETGEKGQIIANTVIASTLRESYPNDSYVGLCFAVAKQPRAPGKQYDKFSIDEIEDPTPAPAVGTEEVKASAPAPSAESGTARKRA